MSKPKMRDIQCDGVKVRTVVHDGTRMLLLAIVKDADGRGLFAELRKEQVGDLIEHLTVAQEEM